MPLRSPHPPQSAQQKTLTVAGYGGSWEQTMRKFVFPAFEAKHGVKMEYTAGNSTDTLAKLQAQKGNQVIDVAIVDDGPMYQAIQLGFCAPIKGLDKADLYDAAKFKDDMAVAVGQTGTGFMVNTKYFQEKGWPIPTSWNDLKDPKFKKLLVIPPINNTYGLYTLMMYARMNGGGEANIEPGFKVMKDEINPNVLVYEPSPGKMTELFQSGQGAIAVWGTGRVQAFANTGFPVDFIYPKEGAPILLASACPVAKDTINPLVHEFINHMVSRRRADGARQGDGQRAGQQEGRCQHGRAEDGSCRRASGEGDRSRLGDDQQVARGLDQALEPRGRAVSDGSSGMIRRCAIGALALTLSPLAGEGLALELSQCRFLSSTA